MFSTQQLVGGIQCNLESSRILCSVSSTIKQVVVSPDEKTLLSRSNGNIARLWDAETGKPLQLFKGHTKHILSVAYSPDGKRVLTGS